MRRRRTALALALLTALAGGGLFLRSRPATASPPLEVGAWPVDLALDTRTARLFVANRATRTRPGSVVVVNTRTTQIVRRVPIEGEAVAVDERTARVFVADVSAGSVHLLDARSGALLRTVGVGLATIPVALGVDERTHRVFVTNGTPTCCAPGTVTLLDARTGRRLRTVTLAGSPLAVAVDAPSGRVYVANGTLTATGAIVPGTVSVLDAVTGTILRTVTVGLTPEALVVSAPTRRVFVLNADSGTVSVLDARTGHRVRTTAVGQYPLAAAVDTHDGQVVVLNAGPFDPLAHAYDGTGSVSVLDATSGRLLHTVGLPQPPRAVAVDARTGHLFIAAGRPTAPAAPGQIVVLDGRRGAPVRAIALPLPSALVLDAPAGRLFVIDDATTVPVVDPWAWLPTWLRRRVPVLPAPAPARSVPASMTTLDVAG